MMPSTLISTITFAVVAWVCTRLFVSYHRLSSAGIPGPFLAGLSNFYRAYYYWNGRLSRKFQDLHRTYGYLVRVGPNHVSISDPDAIPIVHGTNPVFPKSVMYRPLQAFKNGRNVPSIISTLDEDQDTAIRRGIGGAFSINAMHDYEHHVDESIDEFIHALTRTPTVELSEWLQFFTGDVISRVAFSSAPGFLSHGQDVGGSIKTVDRYFARWLRWAAFPEIESLLFRNSIAGMFGGGTSAMGALAMSRLKEREITMQKGPTGERDLLQRYIQAMKKFPDSIDRNAVIGFNISTFAAGSDTTASTLTGIFYYLLHNKQVLGELRSQLHKVAASTGHHKRIPYVELCKTEVLDAIVKESMRCSPAIGFRFERVVPAPGFKISGTFLPQGTIVDCDMRAIHKNKDVFGEDAEIFRPERWIEASPERRRRMERSMITFGSGKRMCLGKEIALMEIKMLISAFVMRFEVSTGSQSELLKICTDMLTLHDTA